MQQPEMVAATAIPPGEIVTDQATLPVVPGQVEGTDATDEHLRGLDIPSIKHDLFIEDETFTTKGHINYRRPYMFQYKLHRLLRQMEVMIKSCVWKHGQPTDSPFTKTSRATDIRGKFRVNFPRTWRLCCTWRLC